MGMAPLCDTLHAKESAVNERWNSHKTGKNSAWTGETTRPFCAPIRLQQTGSVVGW